MEDLKVELTTSKRFSTELKHKLDQNTKALQTSEASDADTKEFEECLFLDIRSLKNVIILIKGIRTVHHSLLPVEVCLGFRASAPSF